MLKKLSLILPILPKLGYRNVAYMVWYRLSLKLGWRKRKFPLGSPIIGTFFKPSAPIKNYPESWKSKTLEKGNRILKGRLTWFHYHNFDVGSPPNWFLNPFDGSVLNNPKKHWTDLSDFDLNTGDVKILWEPSRFDWLTDLARAYRISGKIEYLNTINTWLQDWSAHNPVNQGPNWKCGQETAIRVMKLITVAQILDQDTSAYPALPEMIYQHINRIEGNITYAMVQNNNHGTSEAAGLYIGSVWLMSQKDINIPPGNLQKWKRKGRKALEDRILRLIAPQGTFAQRSVNYHRVVVDTMSWVLYAMERYREPAFTDKILERLQKLGEWQYKMIASPQGDVPNIGANDGAMLETLHNQDYRDFRPSTQLFFGLLLKQKIYENTECDEPLFWRYPHRYRTFSLHSITLPKAEILDNQFMVLRSAKTQLFLKIPSDQFRPSASDAFHLDLWHHGENLLGDSGSYSYNAGEETAWYKSVRAHNTVQIGDAEQMPKISRFLYGNWITADQSMTLDVQEDTVVWSGSYTDYRRNTHRRTVKWVEKKNQITVTDEVKKDNQEMVSLYWHLNSGDLPKENLQVRSREGRILQPEDLTSEYSLYYLEKQKRPTLKYTTLDSSFTTTIHY